MQVKFGARDLFGWLGNRRRTGTAELQGFAICTAPRSGSNLLCQWLTSTGLLGRPLEYFNGPGRRALTDPHYPDDPAAQIQRILTGATSNAVYGLKLFAYHHVQVSPVLDWTQALPRLTYVYLERRDRLEQAISWLRALQAEQYRSTHPVRGAIRYDGPAIRERLDAIDREYRLWAAFFTQRRLMPMRIFYEDAVHDPQGTVDRVAACFGLKGRAIIDPTAIDLEIQRDATTSEWRARYVAEAQAVPRSS